jgi:hypothetical protein
MNQGDSPLAFVEHPEFPDAFRALHPGIVRWPGGNPANNYLWREELGGDRLDMARVVAFVRAFGIELQVVVNFGNGSAHEAADWVRFLNSPDPYWASERAQILGDPAPVRVTVWEIGNEISDPWAWKWSWLGKSHDGLIHLRGGETYPFPESRTDSLYFWGGSLWREGWVPAIAMDPVDAILGHEAFVREHQAESLVVRIPFPPIRTDTLRVWAVDTLIPKDAWLGMTPAQAYEILTDPRFRLDPDRYAALGDTAVLVRPQAPMDSGTVVFVEYETVGHDGAFAFRDSMLAADPSLEIGYVVEPDSVLLADPGFFARLAASPPRFFVRHPYADIWDLLEQGKFSEIVHLPEVKRERLREAQQVLAETLPGLAIGYGLTEWNIALCDDCPRDHPIQGILSGVYVAEFLGAFYEASVLGEVDLRVMNHFALSASGLSFLHLFHVNPPDFEVGVEGVATRLVNQVTAGGLFFVDSISDDPGMILEDPHEGPVEVPTIAAWGGRTVDPGGFGLLVINHDDSLAHAVEIPVPAGWGVDSVYTEWMTGSLQDSTKVYGASVQPVAGGVVGMTLPPFTVASFLFPTGAAGVPEQGAGSSSGIRVYPNPASSRVWFEAVGEEEGVLELVDVSGRRIWRRRVEGRVPLGVHGLPRGMYLLRWHSGSRSRAVKIVIAP